MNYRISALTCVFSVIIFFSFFFLTAQFGKAQDCRVQVTKIADPSDDTQFLFRVVDSDNNINDQYLSDPGLKTVTFLHPPSVTMVLSEEDIPPGWVLDDVTCIDATGVTFEIIDNVVTIDCPQSGFMSCTFTNIFRPLVVSPIPTLSEWGLIAMAGVIGIIGLLAIRRRKVTA